MKNIFDAAVTAEVIERIEKLTPDSERIWGTMTPAQMLAHCCVTYEYVFENKHEKPKGAMKLILKWFVKSVVVSDKSYKKNSRTAPDFMVKESKNFEQEKYRLIDYLKKTQELGTTYFDQKESHSFGVLSTAQWNNMFYKHLDHHLNQFGV